MQHPRTLHLDTERTWRGGEQQAHYLATGLAARGCDVAVAGHRGGAFAERARQAGLTTHELSLRGELNPGAIGALARLLRAGRFDIIHAHTSHAHTQAALASRLAGGVRCVVSRRVDYGLDRSPWKVNRWKYRWRFVDRYIAISDAVREVLVEGGVAPARIDVVPSGIDLSRLDGLDPGALRLELEMSDATPVIVSVAHFAWHKGLEVLVDAAPEVLRRRPDARFLLVGDGELRADLERRTVERGVAGAFRFPGFRDDAVRFLAMADVVATPSWKEGLNTTNLDALALRRPVVASRVGGIPEAVRDGETGLLFEPGDAAGLADRIVRLLDDAELARRLGDQGRRLVERRFTRDAMTDGTLAVYRALLAGRDGAVTADRPIA